MKWCHSSIFGIVTVSDTVNRAVIERRGWGFPPATMNVAPDYFHRKTEEQIEQNETPSCLIPRLLVVFTRQLEMLVTTLTVYIS